MNVAKISIKFSFVLISYTTRAANSHSGVKPAGECKASYFGFRKHEFNDGRKKKVRE